MIEKVANAIKERRKRKERQKAYKGILELRKLLDEALKEGRITEDKYVDILCAAIDGLVKLF